MGIENQPIEDFDVVRKLDWLAHHMADMGRNSTFDLAQYFPEQVRTTQQELAAYAGRVITGSIMTNQYYVAQGLGSRSHSVGMLEYHRWSTNDFAGILEDLQDIHVTMPPLGDRERAGNILCLKVAPIGKLLEYRLTGFYEVRRQHPFGVEEHAGKPIWVPVRPLKEGSVSFVDLEAELV